MSYEHRYDIIKGENDPQDGPQQIIVPVSTPWWKWLLYNLLAAAVGGVVTFVVMRSSFVHSSVSKPAANSTVAADLAASTTHIEHMAEQTKSSSIIATTTTSSIDPAIFTPPAELLEEKIYGADPDHLGTQILDCGGNPEEARAKDCVYDVMMQDWVPKPCYDSILTERYLTAGNWTWYSDGTGEKTLSDEEMRKGEHGSAWMSASYHKAHCVFSWLKIVRALRNGRGISQELLSYDHVLHCAHGALKENSDNEDISVGAPTNYAHCALYETWKLHPITDQHDSTQ